MRVVMESASVASAGQDGTTLQYARSAATLQQQAIVIANAVAGAGLHMTGAWVLEVSSAAKWPSGVGLLEVGRFSFFRTNNVCRAQVQKFFGDLDESFEAMQESR